MAGETLSGIIFDIRRFSIHDGPGIRSAVFLKGCPLACAWCHNPEGIDPTPALVYRPTRCIRCGTCVPACPQGAISLDGDTVRTARERCTQCGTCADVCYAEARELAGRRVTVAQVVAELERDAVFYDESGGGVTFSGGEPLLQADFLLALLRACREKGISAALDTCGFAPWETVDLVRESVALFLYDVKLMDEARHQRFTGASNALILENLRRLARQGQRIVLRLPLIPGVNDDAENIRATGALASDLGIPEVDLLPYHRAGVDKYRRLDREYTLPETSPPAAEQVEASARVLREFGLVVKVGG